MVLGTGDGLASSKQIPHEQENIIEEMQMATALVIKDIEMNFRTNRAKKQLCFCFFKCVL